MDLIEERIKVINEKLDFNIKFHTKKLKEYNAALNLSNGIEYNAYSMGDESDILDVLEGMLR